MTIQNIRQIASNIIPESIKMGIRNKLGICHSKNSLYRLKEFGINPDLVIDAGAYHGIWTKNHLQFFPHATWLIIEPQKQFNSIINDNLNSSPIKFILNNDLLYKKDGVEIDFYIVSQSDCKTGSSIYQENKRELESIKMKSKTLDTLCKENDLLHKKTCLKLDLQGAEVDCLKGSEILLESTLAILLETNILNYNIGSPIYRDVDNYLTSRGFRLFDIAEIHRLEDGRLNQVDLIYLPSENKLFKI